MPRALRILNGRRFSCTQCGNCCRQEGVVAFRAGELERIAEDLAMGADEFRVRFEVKRDPSDGAEYLESRAGTGCPLLTEDGRCSVHPVKPMQCGTWPFWPEMVGDIEEWRRAKTFCPGIDRPDGKLFSVEEIRAIRDFERTTRDPRGDDACVTPNVCLDTQRGS